MWLSHPNLLMMRIDEYPSDFNTRISPISHPLLPQVAVPAVTSYLKKRSELKKGFNAADMSEVEQAFCQVVPYNEDNSI